ncbi:MAG: GatB/YqeY domain-containing protein, partial [Rhodobacteraceae bacterium]|nr:GatB/YqeY domain-containing protein [Paracoccaceae bacterium]
MRDRINTSLREAMKAKDAPRLSTLRLINAAIKDRDIAVRSDGNDAGVADAEILAILVKMIKQRQESATTYEEAGRLELAEKELAEVQVIREFMPRQMDEAEA